MRRVAGPAPGEGPSLSARLAHRCPARIAGERYGDGPIGRVSFAGKDVSNPVPHQTGEQHLIRQGKHLIRHEPHLHENGMTNCLPPGRAEGPTTGAVIEGPGRSPRPGTRGPSTLAGRQGRGHSGFMAQLSETEVMVADHRTSFDHVVVPLDGSEAAGRALTVARRLARALDAELDVVCVAANDQEAGSLREYLTGLDDGLGLPAAAGTVEVDVDPAGTIRDFAQALDRSIICMASHGHGWLATKLLGSVATSVVMSTRRAVIMVGPEAAPGDPAWPILACVDGTATSESTVPIARIWAALLGVRAGVVTVAEPVPASLAPGLPVYRRRFGPSIDAGRYVSEGAARFAAEPGELSASAVYDPLSPADGLVDYLQSHPAQLLVATSRATPGHTHPFVGSVVASLIRHSPVPVLVQPPGY